MRFGARSAAFSVVLLVLFSGLLAGCGGGEEQPQGGGGGEQGNAGQGGAAKKDAPDTKTALGTIRRVNPENNRRIVLKPRAEVQEGNSKPAVFKIRENASITLDGKEAEVGDIKEGQQAQIEYIVKNDVNRALELQLFGSG